MKKFWLRVEFLFIFVAIPVLVDLNAQIFSPIPVLVCILLYILLLNLYHKKLRKKEIFKFYLEHRRLFNEVYNRVLISLIFLMLFILLYDQYLIFKMLFKDPVLWFTLLFIYPVFSVVPQEIIFRSFFFARYKKIFKRYVLVFMSAASFSFAHLVFHNWFAIIFTFIGGLFFAITYHQQRSLLLVVIEHTIYGLFLYTIGYGEFFSFEKMRG